MNKLIIGITLSLLLFYLVLTSICFKGLSIISNKIDNANLIINDILK